MTMPIKDLDRLIDEALNAPDPHDRLIWVCVPMHSPDPIVARLDERRIRYRREFLPTPSMPKGDGTVFLYLDPDQTDCEELT